MGLPTEDNFHGYEQGSLLRKAKKLSGKRLNLFLAHGMADTNVHLQNSMVLAKELVRHNVSFQQQVIINIRTLQIGINCRAYTERNIIKLFLFLVLPK